MLDWFGNGLPVRGSIWGFIGLVVLSLGIWPRMLGFSNITAFLPIKFKKASKAYCCLYGKVSPPGIS